MAVLDWIASRYPALGVPGTLGRTRQLEALAFIATELHSGFKPLWHGGGEADKARAKQALAERFAYIGRTLEGGFLFGDTLGVADCYLFVMLRWADKFGIATPDNLSRLRRRMERRSSVRAALEREGLTPPGARIATSVTENAIERRFERPIDGAAFAAAYYRPEDGKLVFIHTEVPDDYAGQGLATDLAHGAFRLLRETGRKAVLQCPFLVRFYSMHPEYDDVIAR